MRLLVSVLLLIACVGCSGQQQKDKFKDLDRPKPADAR
jgi:hypothetical protein